jgi:hypothetical protein
MSAQPLAECRTYSELVQALRARSDALKLSRGALDFATGLQGGYCGKLLSPIPIRALGPLSLGAILTALGLKLQVVVDPEMVARIGARMDHAVRAGSSGDSGLAMPRPKKRRYPKLGPDWGRLMRARQLVTQSPVERRRIAKAGGKASARARWRKPKGVEATASP